MLHATASLGNAHPKTCFDFLLLSLQVPKRSAQMKYVLPAASPRGQNMCCPIHPLLAAPCTAVAIAVAPSEENYGEARWQLIYVSAADVHHNIVHMSFLSHLFQVH